MTSSNNALETEFADVLSAEELASAYERWEAPHVASVTDMEDEPRALLTVDAIEKLHKEAQQEGFKAGYEDGYQAGNDAGLAAAKKDINAQVKQWQTLLGSLNEPLKALDEAVENDLMKLVMTLAQQFIKHELKQQPERVVDAMRMALAALPITDRKLKIYLHPQDLILVQTGLALDSSNERWQWIEDPLLTRGGVKLETADTSIDATVEARLVKLIDKMLGEEREDGNG